MARLFYHEPQFVNLDEWTRAVSVNVEGFMYEYCRAVSRPYLHFPTSEFKFRWESPSSPCGIKRVSRNITNIIHTWLVEAITLINRSTNIPRNSFRRWETDGVSYFVVLKWNWAHPTDSEWWQKQITYLFVLIAPIDRQKIFAFRAFTSENHPYFFLAPSSSGSRLRTFRSGMINQALSPIPAIQIGLFRASDQPGKSAISSSTVQRNNVDDLLIETVLCIVDLRTLWRVRKIVRIQFHPSPINRSTHFRYGIRRFRIRIQTEIWTKNIWIGKRLETFRFDSCPWNRGICQSPRLTIISCSFLIDDRCEKTFKSLHCEKTTFLTDWYVYHSTHRNRMAQIVHLFI